MITTPEFDVLSSESEVRAISQEWEALVVQHSSMPYGVSSTSNWTLALLVRRILLPSSKVQVLVAREGDNVSAILPGYLATRRLGPMRYRVLGLMPDLYPGRTGLIYDPKRSDLAESVFQHVLMQQETWDIFDITHVAGSSDEAHFIRLLPHLGLTAKLSEATEYPYIQFPNNWDTLQDTFTKKFRYNLRSRERKLAEHGDLKISRYDNIGNVYQFLSDIEVVEQGSWKELAGTSLTKNPPQRRFHAAMAPESAAAGIFRGYVMYMDSAPIAHIVGLYSNDIFYCLKSSFLDTYRKYSPGITLKAMVMKELIADGARFWDFVGPAEDHKMQWTKDTYTLNRYTVYGRTIAGRLLYIRNELGKRLRTASPSTYDADSTASAG